VASEIINAVNASIIA